MVDRLSALDVSFLYLEDATTPMHVGGVLVFARPRGGFDYGRLVSLVEERIGQVPRFRQKVVAVPGHLSNPVWADDPEFDIQYHVRHSALPKPGTDEQLAELVARLMSRRLDRHRPLWEMYCVEGLAGGRFALITKTHHAMVDGISAIDLSQVILDASPKGTPPVEQLWMPTPTPSATTLVRDAVSELARRPSAIVDTVRMAMLDVRSSTELAARAAGGLLATARIAARPAPDGPLNVEIGGQRRFAVVRSTLEDYRKVRAKYGGTVNDVVLATVAGALRVFLMTRGEPVGGSTVIRAMVPVSVRTESEQGELGNRVLPHFIELPVGEPNPVLRLSRISYAMQAHKTGNQASQTVGARALIKLSGFAPPTLHALGARAAGSFARKFFNVVVTNVPGPQQPLYATGARMLEVFPVVPLAKGQPLSIGLTSYNGGVYYGLNADRDAMGDVDVIGSLIAEALAELVDTT
ncbi:MAG TPA: wax ester/triacylglycerol synthase family O-acyltransferase [Mycobacteriales bacterium]|jgi:WS/DGAT/MGAT family acyltransferase|nr:wax ester/triacylglycerol synthase family O-acyltransferase [Mycobacteriales bacterium]